MLALKTFAIRPTPGSPKANPKQTGKKPGLMWASLLLGKSHITASSRPKRGPQVLQHPSLAAHQMPKTTVKWRLKETSHYTIPAQ